MILDYLTVGQKIKNLRISKNLTQAQLAEIIGLSTSYMSYLENGIKFISVETMIAISNALGCSPDYLLAESLEQYKNGFAGELSLLLEDCSAYECRVLLDNLKSLKTAMRSHGNIIVRRK